MPRRWHAPGGSVHTVSGRVVRVRARRDGGWRVRLAETGGTLAVAEIRLTRPMPLPPRGAYILIRGTVCYDEEHAWYAVDPVEAWVHARISIRGDSVSSGLFPSGHHRGWLGFTPLRT
jgi:hypothetical protein